MFEGQFPDSVFHPARDESAADGKLRAFGWDELNSRLAAARELRTVLRDRRLSGGASFAALGAGRTNLLKDLMEQGKRPVNHDDLGHCKSSCRNGDDHDHDDIKITGDREAK